jgi:hypothetical protein
MIRRALFVMLLLSGCGSVSAYAQQCPGAGAPAATFGVGGLVVSPTIFDQSRLQLLPQAQENVTFFASGAVTTASYTGVLLWDLLNNSPVGGIVTDPNVKNDILHKVVIVTGSDCYQAVFGAGELDPAFGDSQVMIAFASNGQPLGSEGFAKLIAPGDKEGGRFVSNIVWIVVRDPTYFR